MGARAWRGAARPSYGKERGKGSKWGRHGGSARNKVSLGSLILRAPAWYRDCETGGYVVLNWTLCIIFMGKGAPLGFPAGAGARGSRHMGCDLACASRKHLAVGSVTARESKKRRLPKLLTSQALVWYRDCADSNRAAYRDQGGGLEERRPRSSTYISR
jgi:hypothetical protein